MNLLSCKDNPYHEIYILGGAWGLYNSRNRNKANEIYSNLKNKLIASMFHKMGEKYIKGKDQDFLGLYVWPLVKDDSISHDSYTCGKFGGIPFPTKRQGNCFICNFDICDPINGKYPYKCPKECRPSNGTDWEYC